LLRRRRAPHVSGQIASSEQMSPQHQTAGAIPDSTTADTPGDDVFGYNDTQHALELLKPQMTSEQIAEAQRSADAWNIAHPHPKSR
jgi:hypothetical protein